MPSVFLSYRKSDQAIAKALQAALEAKGHETRMDEDLVVGDDWRKELFEALQSSDAVVPLLTEDSLQSHFVAAEIGAARAFHLSKGMFLLPVIVGDIRIPPFVQDVLAVQLHDGSPIEVDKAAGEIDKAIATHIARIRGKYPRIFISHRHKDEPVAEALVRLIEGCFDVGKEDMRCTSVHPYRLKAGERTPDRLQKEISRAKAVLGIVTPDMSESSYVLFELGAAWGQAILTFPLLAKGASIAHIPAPISDLHPLDLTKVPQCFQLIDDLADVSGLPRRKGDSARIAELTQRLAEKAAEKESDHGQ